MGAHYEVANGVVTKYYYAGSQRIALRNNGTLNFLLGDHLGSTSMTTSATGVVISELRYKAWGETRYASGTTPTNYTYTGQYSYAGSFGLMFYNARWYDPSLGRFAQSDSIIPIGIQGLDRYAYANNNPFKYTDPSGHKWVCTGANNDHCYDDGQGQVSGMVHAPSTSAPSTPVSSGTLVIACGSGIGGMGGPGPACNGTAAGQMSIWNSATLPGYNIVYSQYPGYHKYYDPTSPEGDPAADTDIGKSGQTKSIYNQVGNTQNVTVVGYSSGVDVAVFYAELRQKTGMQTKGLALLGPANPFKGYDTEGALVDTDGFVERVINFSKSQIEERCG